jgi:PncC family amidohydrolase
MTTGGAPLPGSASNVPTLAVAFPEAALLGARLVERRMTIAVGESCTGGLLGAVLTATAGSSAYMRGGIIAYANDIKADHLGVGRHLLVTHGAVSAEVAMAMAEGASERFKATIGVGITGVAGPEASEQKPAGLVFVAVAGPGSGQVLRLSKDLGREANRASAVHTALRLCLEFVEREVEGGRRDLLDGPPDRAPAD